ncbi:hypothetical protein [Methylibium petroleiphilum]|uniref:Uncharacterized protein n=1 Tax=Methylibium petroleiphilum (strain ATCC BAA-1232 / LMG 22953 / PM1) TaxID=420662 RepID=A2SMT7_METPP|nr:hypothetical protein [Methylibium petroleiphilum]ABM96876.1 hypothetical protein Mpe_B0097 [Methylibium petroleiphilum PM1]
MSIKALALAIEQNYAAGMSGGDDTQFQALIDLGDQAAEIIKMEDELVANRETLRRVWALAQQLQKSLGWIETFIREHGEWWGSEDVDTAENEWLSNARDLLKLFEDVPKTAPEASAARHSNPLSMFTETELLDELRGRGAVASVWTAEDLSFLDEDAPEGVTDEELPALKARALESAGRSLEDILGARGNEHLADWWHMNCDDVMSAHEESLVKACEAAGVEIVDDHTITWQHGGTVHSGTGSSFESVAAAARDAIRTLRIKI